jgi:uncharacterized protein (TIGR00255 family)
MPVYSMTGYASATVTADAARDDGVAEAGARAGAGASVTVELRSVNSRFLDLTLRLPDEYRALEPALREVVSAGLKRGKVELRLTAEAGSGGAANGLSPELLHQLAHLEGSVQNWLPKAAGLSVFEVLQWSRGNQQLPALDQTALEAARLATERLREAREREGERLVGILMERVHGLRALAQQAEPLLPQVVARQRERFLQRWHDALAAAGAASSIDEQSLHERAMAEAASFALRIDVAEELSRLAAHLDEIERLLTRQGGELGKRLDFLIQELHRESNTLGSKSAALELTQISVEMKVLVEQLREQVQNVE